MKKRTKRIFVAILSVFVLVAGFYLYVNLSVRNEFQTEVARTLSVDVGFSGEIFVLRNEVYLTSDDEGVVSYQLADGEKIQKGGEVAKIFRNETDAAANREIARINSAIDSLSHLKKATGSGAGFDALGNKLNLKLNDLIYSINSEDYSNLDKSLDDLIFSVTERQLLTGEEIDIQKKIDELTAQKEEHEQQAKAVGSCKTNVAGYFSSTLDGYEYEIDLADADWKMSFNDDSVSEITMEQLEKFKKQNTIPQNAIGKIIKGLNWYIICPITKEQSLLLAGNVKPGDDISIELPFAASSPIKTELLAITTDASKGSGHIVLKCNYYNEKTTSIRFESAEILIDRHTGLRVSKQALYDDYLTNSLGEKKKVQGVYVLYGNKLVFKQVDIIYSGKDFVLCDPTPDIKKLVNGRTIELYDEIVVKGDDLFDGKVVY